MALTTGVRIGAYEVGGQIGVGGMGEVYEGIDTNLKRSVAIKVLPPSVAGDADRLMRFQREAEILAALNHPNIAAIYGLERSGSTSALVMELVNGPTLADRIRQGAIPLAEARPIARQIAEAVEAAHEQGIIHRDLKPANIKIREDGTVKVLDFGLAKAIEPEEPAGASASMSPTITTPAMTEAGVILGTAAYMSPEQARGKVVDKRCDVWAFGCVMYEMLTGRRAFDGEEVADVLATVLKSDPDWTAFPADVPPFVRSIVQRCLVKERKARIPNLSVLRYLLEAPDLPSAPLPVRSSWWMPVMAAAAATLAVAVIAQGLWSTTRPSLSAPIARLDVVLPTSQVPTRGVTISPDGQTIVYVSDRRLYWRALADVDVYPMEGTSDPIGPLFSPDGKWVAFYSIGESRLKKVALAGGAAVTICETDVPFGATWGRDDRIMFANNGVGKSRGIVRVSANGGTPELLIAAGANEVLQSPRPLPDGDHVVFAVTTGSGPDRWDTARIVVQSVRTGERKTLIEGGSDPRLVANGRLLYALGASILAVPFDAANLAVTGAPVRIVSGVGRNSGLGVAAIAFADNGTLVHLPVGEGSDIVKLALVNRDGRRTLLPVPAGRYSLPRVSPDGKSLALLNVDDQGKQSIWICDLSGATSMRRLTFESATALLWTQDGRRIIFGSNRRGGTALYSQAADGTGAEERLTDTDLNDQYFPNSVTADGELLAFYNNRNGGDVWTVRLEGDHALKPLISVPTTHEDHASFSPDGRWVAYRSNATGRYEVYVQPLPATGAKYQITTTGAHSPLWSRDGRQLFYVETSNTSGRLTWVDVRTEPSFAVSSPVSLSIATTFAETLRPYDVMPDGTQFIVTVPNDDPGSNQVTAPRLRVILNWLEELKERVPSK